MHRARAARFRLGGGAKGERVSVSQVGGLGGMLDFNSSKMTGNAVKITNEMFNFTRSVLFLVQKLINRLSSDLKGATSRHFASDFTPNKSIVKLKETTKHTHGRIEKY